MIRGTALISGYGFYKDATTPEVEPTDDLTNAILLIATLGGSGGVDLGANALKAVAERLGIGAAGREAVTEAGEQAYEKEIAEAIASGEGKHASFVRILARAREARLGAGAETESAQQEARADLIDGLLDNADKAGVMPDGVKDAVADLAHNGWAYTSYTTAKLDAVRTALLQDQQPGRPRRGADPSGLFSATSNEARPQVPDTPEVDPEFAELVAGRYYAFEDNLERCARLTRLYHDGATASELHEEALAGARRIAYVERVDVRGRWRTSSPCERLPDGVLPLRRALGPRAPRLCAHRAGRGRPCAQGAAAARTTSTASRTSTRSRMGHPPPRAQP